MSVEMHGEAPSAPNVLKAGRAGELGQSVTHLALLSRAL
jgi:hypothetical protein